MISALVKAILSILRGSYGWNSLNLLRILYLEEIVKEFRWFCDVVYLFTFWAMMGYSE